MNEPTTTASGIDLEAIEAMALQYVAEFVNYGTMVSRIMAVDAKVVLALIERLRASEAKHEEQVGREIRVRNNVIAELEVERDELKESLRTTRLEQAAKAFQVDDLETQVERLTTEHEKDRQAWMSENTKLLTQVARLTAERDELLQEHIDLEIYPKDRLQRLEIEKRDLILEVRRQEGLRKTVEHETNRLRKQVERLTEELGHPNVGR